MGFHAIVPHLLQADTPDALQIDLIETTCAGVETGGEHENVELELRVGRLHALRRDALDGCLTNVYQRHVVLVEQVVEVLLQRRSLAAKRMHRIGGCQFFLQPRVIDARPRLVAPEVVGQPVRRFVIEDVGEGAHPEMETALLPGGFK